MPFVQQASMGDRVLYLEAKGSGLIMYADKIPSGTGLTPKKVLVEGKLTDAARLADTSLLAMEGAAIRSLDSGLLYIVSGATWGVFTAPGESAGLDPTQLAEINGLVSGITKDGSGKVTAVTGVGWSSNITYDASGRVSSITNQDNVTRTVTYNPDGSFNSYL